MEQLSETDVYEDFYDEEVESEASSDELKYNGLSQYFDSLNKELLTAEEEKALGRLIQAGRKEGASKTARIKGKEAEDKLTEHNLKLVISVAKKYIGRSQLELDDLIQEGNFGLMEAVRRFDPEMDCKFSTYATWWIRQSIIRNIDNKGRTIRIPAHKSQLLYQIQKTYAELEMSKCGTPTMEEVAKKLNVKPESIIEYWSIAGGLSSLDQVVGEDQDGTLYDIIIDKNAESPMENVINSDIHGRVYNLLGTMSPREKDIIVRRFGLDGSEPQTLEEIAKFYHVTRERIRQIESRAIGKLRIRTRRGGYKEMLD